MPNTDDPADDDLSQRLRRALRTLPDAPLALQQAAIELWPHAPGLLARAQAALSRVSAALTFDSWAAPALAAGVRSLRSPTRQLLYSAQGRDIDLRIAPAEPDFALAGQVLGPDESGVVELARLDGVAGTGRTVALDALGEFRIDGVTSGIYVLTLVLGSDEIVLPPVDVGEQAR